MAKKLTPEEIDALKYSEAVKAVRESGISGTWIAVAKTSLLKAVLRGEMTPADAARSIGLGSVGLGGAPAAAAPSAAPTDLLSAAFQAAVQPKIEELRSQLVETCANLWESIEENAGKAASGVPDELREELSKELDDLRNQVQSSLNKREEGWKKLQAAVEDAIAKGNSSVPRAIAPLVGVSAASSSATDEPVTLALMKFCQPGAALKPVLIKGGQGSGKTYGAREWGKKFDVYIEYGFHPDTSSSDFLGFPTAIEPWVDGPVTRAWRLAAEGKLVFLLLDEIYRAQKTTRQTMLTPLSKRIVDGKYYYALTTGRPVVDPVTGVSGCEEILAPCENLAIVGTTNVGARFDIEADCGAGKERFVPIHVEVEESKLRSVLLASATAKGYDAAIVEYLIAFWKECKILTADNFLEICPTTRILNEAVLYSANEADVPATLSMLGMNIWVAETLEGLPEPEQVKKVQAAIAKNFKK